MGFWGANLYSNDTTCDVRDSYINYLSHGVSDEEALKNICLEYQELMGTDEEFLYWIALADTQWNLGRLERSVKMEAMSVINSSSWTEWCEDNQIKQDKFIVMINNLKEKLNKEMPQRKVFRKIQSIETNPWNVGDMYAYQLHTEKAIEHGMQNKYMVFQKIGNVEYYKNVFFSVVQVYNKVFDSLPTPNELKGVDVLPFVRKADEGYIPSLEWFSKASMIYEKKSQYPKKHFSFIGNVKVVEREYVAKKFDSFYLDKNYMDEWLILYYLSWNNGIE